MVKTPCSECRGPEFIPWSRNWIPFLKKNERESAIHQYKNKSLKFGGKVKNKRGRGAFLTPWLGQGYLFIDTLGMVGMDVLHLLKSVCPRAGALQQEKILQ